MSAPRELLRSLLLYAAARRWAPDGSAPPDTPRRILVIRPDHLGDVLFLTPALRALRQAQPEAEITALVGPWAAPLLAMNPDVDHVETLAFPWFDRQPKKGWLAPYRTLAREAARLRGRYDTALIARFDHWWGAWLAAQAGIPRLIGYDVPGVAPFLTDRVPYVPGQHEAIQNLALTARLGTPASARPDQLPLRYEISGAHRLKARQLLNESGLAKADGPLVAIHPGSGAPVKRWGEAQWGELMGRMRAQHGVQFVITGGPDEILLASRTRREVPEGVPVASVAGETTLPELAALFELCDLVVGADSGPLHLAVAMGRPTVHLYGPVDPQTFGPWGPSARHRVVTQSLACQFCNRLDWTEPELPDHPCVSAIPLGMVEEAVGTVLEAQKSGD